MMATELEFEKEAMCIGRVCVICCSNNPKKSISRIQNLQL